MSLEHIVQTEVKDPAYATIARTISGMAAELKADGHDQETIRQALHVFLKVSSEAGQSSSELVNSLGGRRPY